MTLTNEVQVQDPHVEMKANRHGSTQQLGEEQWDNTTQLLLVPLSGTHQSTPTSVHSRLGAQHLKPTVG